MFNLYKLSQVCLRQNHSINNFKFASPHIFQQFCVSLSRLSTKTTSNLESVPKNEPILEYSPNSNTKHKLELEKCLESIRGNVEDVPIVIKGKEFRTDEIRYQSIPFDHKEKIAKFYYASPDLIKKAIKVAIESKKEWQNIAVEDKLKLFERAADLVGGKFRQSLNASTMLGQAKTVKQAEIDAAGELADFLRFNAYYMKQLIDWQQPRSTEFEKNSLNFRPLDGFVAAISPFNFTAIGGNLATAPTLMGNTVLWKPSDTAILSNYAIFKLLQEAGFPDGVINFVPCEGFDFGRVITGNSSLAGVNFTGSLVTFQWLWSEIGANIKRYKTFPRLVGECGGKNFHLIHKSAHVDTAVAQTIRSAFEYSGQKCSACSRLYVPASLWDEIRDKLVAIARDLKIGPATDYSVYTSAVIDANAFKRITNYIGYADACKSELKLLCGGEANDEVGYFIKPTIFETSNPANRLMVEEIFGPVLTVYVYPDAELDETLDLINGNPYALTGAIFAQDEHFITKAKSHLQMSAGNFYINDKSTGAVVGQQPFGGSKLSGTNDKAGGPHYLMRWCNQQTVKRTNKELPYI